MDDRIFICQGALAQLGAHHTGSVGVRGSSPLCSTLKVLIYQGFFYSCCISCCINSLNSLIDSSLSGFPNKVNHALYF